MIYLIADMDKLKAVYNLIYSTLLSTLPANFIFGTIRYMVHNANETTHLVYTPTRLNLGIGDELPRILESTTKSHEI